MQPLPTILALDVATTTGCAEGRPGEKPRTWRWHLGPPGTPPEERGFRLLSLLSEHLAVSKPRLVAIEAPLAPRVLVDIGSTIETASFQLGTAFLARVVAHGRGASSTFVNVQDVRQFFVGRRRFKGKNEGKQAVMQHCQALGWEPTGFDEADAAALWAFACHKHFPRHAARVEPLFAGAQP